MHRLGISLIAAVLLAGRLQEPGDCKVADGCRHPVPRPVKG